MSAGDAPHDVELFQQGSQTAQSVDIFVKEWRVYSKAVDLNVLEHQKLFAALQPILQLLASRGPVDIADLGCGDCAFTAHTLLGAGVQLASFTAVDVAGPALQLARHNLAFLPPNCCVSLVEQSLQDFVLQEECAGRFDVVISAFAVHHLSLQSKQEFLGSVASCLRPGGLFALIDVFKADGETAASWKARAKQHIDATMSDDKCTAEERATIWRHVSTYDNPEDVPTYKEMGAAAGFSRVECVHVGPANLYRLLALYK